MRTVAKPVEWRLRDHPHVVIGSTLFWDEELPLEVMLVMHVGDEPVEWRFGRDLLLDAIEKNVAGLMDVKVQVANDTMFLHLHSPFGEQHFTTTASIVGQFLAETLGITPRGEEDTLGALNAALVSILDEYS